MVNNIAHNNVSLPPTISPNIFKKASITQVDLPHGFCYAKDALGKEYQMAVDYRPKGTGVPSIGEIWMIERKNNAWVLEGLVGHPNPHVITGAKAGKDTLALQLLAALAALGHVTDNTT